MIARSLLWSFIGCCALGLLCSCGKASKSAGDADDQSAATKAAVEKKSAAAEDGSHEGVSLKPEEVAKLGLVSAPLKEMSHAPEALGYGVIAAHESIAQAVAELRSAAAVARQSQSALERNKRLVGTPGAMPLDTLETAERQATVDSVALELAKRRLSSSFGQHPPWKDASDSPQLAALASGESKLIRATFSADSLTDGAPTQIRVARIGVGDTAKSIESQLVWSAPADATIPGRSFFAIAKGPELGEGERVLAWAPVGQAVSGVFLPAAAALISNGKYWCYIEEEPGHFVRFEFDPSVPVSGGYFVTQGLKAGDKVVIAAVGILLARELNPSTEAE
jgi:hypothetical protein